MSNKVATDLEFLTSTIVDVRNKPHLRSIIGYQLVQLQHKPKDVEAELDTFFGTGTVH